MNRRQRKKLAKKMALQIAAVERERDAWVEHLLYRMPTSGRITFYDSHAGGATTFVTKPYGVTPVRDDIVFPAIEVENQ